MFSLLCCKLYGDRDLHFYFSLNSLAWSKCADMLTSKLIVVIMAAFILAYYYL